MDKFDLIVVGAGPSGYAAAMRAVDFKKKVLLIEKGPLGGAGVTNGALSSKTWWEISRQIRTTNERLDYYHMTKPNLNFKEIKDLVDGAVNYKIKILRDHMLTLGNGGNGGITFMEGTAFLLNDHEVRVSSSNEEKVVYGEYIVLAAGSRPRRLPNLPIDDKIVMTSDSLHSMTDFPKSMVIVGAGVIGCEFATIFSGMRMTKVHLIDKGDHILPFEDEDVVKVIEDNMEANGVLIHRNSQLIRMDIVDGQVEYELEYDDGKKEIFTVEKALVSVGRVPNYENLWAENVNIELTPRGIKDRQTQTSVPNIFAVGDITADIALVNVGELEGRFAVESIFGKPERKLIYENISTIMFLNPEVAGVGLNETQAIARKIDFKVVTLDYSAISRAIAERNTQGFIKLLVRDEPKMRILGMRVVGNQASSAIQAVAVLISMNKGIEELAECVHPHPSITEGIQECVRMLLGKSMYKPRAMKGVTFKKCCKGIYRDIECD